ncbi:MAG: response regulator [Verrucomicrobiota bacterium JB022]|nr:response regulator [Verrucomicrobiota bacterium JB022]
MNKILLVEDDPRLRDSVAQMLEFEGFLVLAEENGRLAWQALDHFRPDIVVSDVMMPEMDGIELLEAIRAHPGTQNIPVILLTAKASRDDTRAGMSKGADDYITKPFEIDELVASIEAQIGKRSTRLSGLDNLEYTVKSALPSELFSPLHTILGLADGLEEQLVAGSMPTRDDLWEAVRNMKDSGRRLLRQSQNLVLCRELMELLGVDAKPGGSCIPTDEDFQADLDAALRAVADQRQREEDLEAHFERGVLAISPCHFIKTVTELVDNALKFSRPGQIVTVRGRVEGCQTYVLEVHDAGLGMASHEIEHIGMFRQFNRREGKQEGLGLGLAIVQMLSQLYGGKLALQSGEGNGLTVRMELPLKVAAPPVVAMPELPPL